MLVFHPNDVTTDTYLDYAETYFIFYDKNMAGIRIKTAFESQPFWQQFLAVLVFNTLIAFLIHAFLRNSRFIEQFIYSQSIGLSILFSYLLFAHVIKLRGWKLLVPLITGSLLGVLVVMIVQAIMYQASFDMIISALQKNLGEVFTNFIFPALFFGAIIIGFFAYREKALRTRTRLQAEQIQNLDHQKQHAETHLRLLQAQIEPHFLFNTLANVISLIDIDPQKSKTLLESLTTFLRTSLKRSSEAQLHLEDEIKLLRSYLEIMKIRMGERLDYQIHYPDDVENIQFPPLLLQPVVENAIIHGIEPLAEGGEISIDISKDNEWLSITVSDNGRGLQADHSKGFGLGNIRDRLHSIYGKDARLRIEGNTPRGVKVMIEVPYVKA